MLTSLTVRRPIAVVKLLCRCWQRRRFVWQDPVVLLDDVPRHMWMWLALVLTPRAFWRDKVELYVSGVKVCEKLARYPTMKALSHVFIGG